ncbi:MAG: ComEA family DNA-binding protein, partial [Dehalococcoidia bacterium]|nr:ComEA family DNA-binding protein [Dehalococcoidia bacterium]
ALTAAGGAAPQADLSRLNMATRVRDEMQIYVPLSGENTASPFQAADSRLDINTASVALLDTLPEIGSVTAQNIIAYREKNGPFKRVEELTEAKLVGSAAFAKIKDLIIVR